VSRERAMAALRLQPTDAIPRMEMIDNDELMRDAGFEPANPREMENIWPKLSQKLGLDFVCHQYEMPAKGRYTRLGHAEWNTPWGYDGETGCPFATTEEVLAFDPAAEWGIAPHAEMTAEFRRVLEAARAAAPDVAVPGGRYNTVFSACIRAFGWEMFLASVPGHEREFDRVLEGFTEISIAESRAWADAGVEVFMTHDDIAWTSGPVFAPDWYRRYVFPRYTRIWQPLKERGIPVIYLSDGDYSPFVDDIAAAGADGFIFEPCVSLGMMAGKFGRTKALLGNADCRVLMSGDGDDVEREVRRCVDLGRDCPGYFMLMSNHIPNNVPYDNVRRYFDAFERLRGR
jgi:hypothetical protein